MSYGLFSWYDVIGKYNALNRLGTSPSPEQAKVLKRGGAFNLMYDLLSK